jgi:hypothetical protein
MKGIVRKISKVTRNKKDGETFNQIVITVDVIVDEEKKTLKTRSAYLSEKYAKEYAEYCKLSSNDMIGKEVSVVLEKRMYEKDGVKKTSENIKYLNFIDEEGHPIIMKKDDSNIGF